MLLVYSQNTKVRHKESSDIGLNIRLSSGGVNLVSSSQTIAPAVGAVTTKNETTLHNKSVSVNGEKTGLKFTFSLSKRN